MTTLISLGCNCHPAWWLRKLGLRAQSFPYDWLLTKPHTGLDYAVQVFKDGYTGWLDDLSVNERGHPVAARYPQAELFHHHAIVGDDPAARAAEAATLERRAQDFVRKVAEGDVTFLYCYALRGRLPAAGEMRIFEASVDLALATWPTARLHVYFLSDNPGLLAGAPLLAPRPRLMEHAYFRDQSVDKNWGTEPSFFRALGTPSASFDNSKEH